MNHNIATKHTVSYPDVRTICSSCEKESLLLLLAAAETMKTWKRSRIQDVRVDLDPIMKDHRDPEIRGELTTCKHSWLSLNSLEVDNMF